MDEIKLMEGWFDRGGGNDALLRSRVGEMYAKCDVLVRVN